MENEKMTETKEDQRNFREELSKVSVSLSVWAMEKFQDGWSIADVKLHLRNAAKECGRD